MTLHLFAGLLVWTLAEERSIYIVEHAEGAGRSVVTNEVGSAGASS